jgi:hypothetical protein
MINKISMILILSGLLGSSGAMAHGEDKPGPNQGYLRMPGAFHTEVVPFGDAFKIYLLDISFKDPVTANSTVAAWLKQAGESKELTCAPAKDFFSCKLPTGVKLDNGILEVKASRLGAPSGPAQYDLPLRFLGNDAHKHKH